MSGPVCRSCGAPIRWVISDRGRSIPIDDKPDPKGLLVLQPHEDGRTRAVHFGTVVPGDAPRFTSHFATCPQAAQWRQPR